MTDFTIRRATAGDVVAILRCLHVAFEPYREQYSPAGFADTTLSPETIQARMGEMTLFVARDVRGEVVGTIGCAAHGDTGHVRGMAVVELGTGAADALLSAAEDELRGAGCTRITLDTTLPLRRAMRFYEKHGYKRSGHVGDFYGMPLIEYAKKLLD